MIRVRRSGYSGAKSSSSSRSRAHRLELIRRELAGQGRQASQGAERIGGSLVCIHTSQHGKNCQLAPDPPSLSASGIWALRPRCGTDGESPAAICRSISDFPASKRRSDFDHRQMSTKIAGFDNQIDVRRPKRIRPQYSSTIVHADTQNEASQVVCR
jgi:hypothetical protein